MAWYHDRLGLRIISVWIAAAGSCSALVVPLAPLPSRAARLARLPAGPGSCGPSWGRRNIGPVAARRATAPRPSARNLATGNAAADMLEEVKVEPEGPDDVAWGGEWRRLSSVPAELRCGVTLVCGQSFRWRVTGDNEWTGVIADRIVTVREDTQGVHMTTCEQAAPLAAGATREEGAVVMQRVRPDDALMAAAAEYFGLATPLAPLYQGWGEADALWAQLAVRFPGLRVLRQDPVECLFCFICSSNNNIARIALMVDRLSERYGKFLGAQGGYNFYSFPSIEALAAADEDDLRALGTGYRAKFILQSAATVLQNGGKKWLQQLRSPETSHVQARDALITLHGVGLKVADCVCLFALDKPGAIPVDTHVWQITLREMDATLSEAKSLTPTIYDQVGRLWRDRYGNYAGWAHTILFAADLTKFKKLRNEALGEDSASSSPKKRKSPSKAKRETEVEAHLAAPDAGAKKKHKSAAKEASSPSKSRLSSDADEYQDTGLISPLFAPTPGAKTKAQRALHSTPEARAGKRKSAGASARSLKPRQLLAAQEGHAGDTLEGHVESSAPALLQAGGVKMGAKIQAGVPSPSSSSKGDSPLPKIPRKKRPTEKTERN
jgi:N-glycosylase/DNA lyase